MSNKFEATFHSGEDFMASGLIYQLVRERLQAETDLIEFDLLQIPGVHYGLTPKKAHRLGLLVVHQVSPVDGVTTYRGIQQWSRWVVDYHPEWPWNEPPVGYVSDDEKQALDRSLGRRLKLSWLEFGAWMESAAGGTR